MFTVDEVLAMEKMVVKNNRCTRVQVSYGFRGMGNSNTYPGSGLSSYATYDLDKLDGKDPVVINEIDFGSGAYMHLHFTIKAIVDDIIYCVKNGEVFVGKTFKYSDGIAHDTLGIVKIELC